MEQSLDKIPDRLREIIDDFTMAEDREKVEMLLEYSDRMPPLPDWLRADHNTMDFVEECMTPVYVKADVHQDKMAFYFDVPAESPTVRGFAAILGEGLAGVSPDQVLNIPNDFFLAMGLERVLTMQRLNGLSAILAHMKRLAFEAIES